MSKTSKTCKWSVKKDVQTYIRVAFTCHIHVTTTCSGLSPAENSEIEELGQNVLLLCDACIKKNEWDAFNSNRPSENVKEIFA